MAVSQYVFDNQKKAWDQLEKLVNENTLTGKNFKRAVLLAQPQVGKTSFMIWGAIQRAKKAKELGVRYLNVIAISDSNNALRDQTVRDLKHALTCAGLIEDEYYFQVVHRSSLKFMHYIMPPCEVLTVFVDEAHIAARTGGGRDSFQRYIYDNPASDKLLVDVGATSFAHIALHNDPSSPYDMIIELEPGPAYNSVEHMYEQGRVRQVETLTHKNGAPTRFLSDRIATLQRHGGYTLIRATGKRHTAVIRALRLVAPTLPIIEADMFGAAVAGRHVPIAEIPTVLCQRPEKPTIMLVRGALRVGIVLPVQASGNICEMIDTNAVRADTVTQSFVGRSCGYDKRNDTYGIFTNLKDIETVIDFYSDVKAAIPVGLKNTGAHRTGRYEVVDFVVATQQVKDEHKLVSKCSLNNENDVADHVLRGVNTWDSRLVLIDKPNPNYQKSWQLLVANRPELIRNYVTYNPERNWYTGAQVHENFIDLGYMTDEAAE